MSLTARTLADAMRIGDQAAALWIDHVNAALIKCGCQTREQIAMWLAQVGHESAGLTRLVESLDYSAEALAATWPTRFTLASAALIGRTRESPANQRQIAERVYGGRLGNVNPGDGWTYRGRGPIQVTGKDNYHECGEHIGVDLVAHPDLLELRSTGALSTAWYWQTRGIAAMGGDVDRVTRAINGGTHGIDDRRVRYVRALSVLGGGKLRRIGSVAP